MADTIRTEMLTYNVHDRGRKHRGVERLFDTVALAKLINSPETQERVKKGDLIGYYGHWARVKFGMATQEVGLLDGKIVATPTAVRTVYLSCDTNGNITHQAEFLNTEQGKYAASLYASKAGGWSSAIDAIPGSKPSIPVAFQGMDYVLEPNYDTNRGYVRGMLDSVTTGQETPEELIAFLDSAIAGEEATASYLVSLLDSVTRQNMQALEALEVVTRENEQLIERLARGQGGAILDDVGERLAPFMAPRTPAFERFRTMELQPLREIDEPELRDNSPEGIIVRRLGL